MGSVFFGGYGDVGDVSKLNRKFLSLELVLNRFDSFDLGHIMYSRR